MRCVLIPTVFLLSSCGFVLEPASSDEAWDLADGGVRAGLSVDVEQDGLLVPVVDGVAELRRAPFTLIFDLPPGDSVLVAASRSPETWQRAADPSPLATFPPFESTGMAEYPANANRQLALCDTAPSYWVDQTDFLRFDAPCERRPAGWACRRTVESLQQVEHRDGVTLLADVEFEETDALFFVFADIPWANGRRTTERFRERLALFFAEP